MTKAKDTGVLNISRIERERIVVPIIGASPLITNHWSEKAKAALLGRARGERVPKQPKDPEAEFKSAAYRFASNGDYGLPAVAFKCATVGAARFYSSDVTMVGLRLALWFFGELGKDGQQLVKIEADEPTMREDPVTVGRGGTELRYRPQFWPWSANLTVDYVKAMLTRDSVVSLIDAGGMVGVGEWRTEKDGDFGLYRVDDSREIEIVE